MKKIISLILCTLAILIIYFIKQDNNKYIAVYLDNIEGTSIPDRNSNYIIDKIICDNDAVGTWDNANWGLLVTNLSKRSNCKTYFRSKKDITVIYDNNYIENNIFDKTYKTSKIEKNQIFSTNTNYNLTLENGYLNYKFTADTDEKIADYSTGYFIWSNNKLKENKTFTFQFLIKGNTSYKAYIGSEQEITTNYEPVAISITNKWSRITRTFTSSDYPDTAFVFYGWISKTESRILEVRNLSLQEGEYNNFSTTILKEYDNLNNTLPTPTRENYTFLGWYTDPIEGEKISSETIVTEDTTYYAHWQYNESE